MYGEFYSGTNLLVWPLVGLGIFLAAFVGVLYYVSFILRDRRKIDRVAALPLEDDDGHVLMEGESENDR